MSRSIALAALALAAAIAPRAVGAQALAVQTPPGERLVWRGLPAADSAGGTGAMLYPAPNLGGFLAAVLTHAALVQGGREAERRERQLQADKVLAPYEAVLAGLAPAKALDAARQRLPATLGEGLAVEMEPVLQLSPDQRTLMLDASVKVRRAGAPASQAPAFAGMVRVISHATPPDAPPPAWLEEGRREALADEAVAMLAHGLEIGLLAAQGREPPATGAYRTQRYRFGGEEKYERAATMAKGCRRLVLLTLRDWLVSVPVQAGEGEPACTPEYRLTPPAPATGS